MSLLRVRLPRLATVLALLGAVALVAGCRDATPPPAVTSQGQEIRNLYDIVFVIAVVVFLAVEGAIVYAVIRYRRRPGDTQLPAQTHGNNLVEVIWTVIPTIIVVYLFVISWQTLNTVEAKSPNPDVRVRAIARQFQWGFDYLAADGNTVLFHTDIPEMSVPVGQTVHMTLRSVDVIHAFYVPEFLFKRDVVPGRENNFDFTVDPKDVGQSFRGQCAELCGTFHAAMQFSVKAMAPNDYQTWVQQQIQAAKQTPPPAPSGSAGPGASPSGSAAPGGSPAASGSAAAAGPTVDITAQGIQFQQTSVTAPANTAFTINFVNNDAGTPHNVQIHEGNAGGNVKFDGDLVTGVTTTQYHVPALPAGSYTFVCKVHPTMTGTLTVQ